MVAIGTFDGVHVGHQAVIRRAIEIARERGVTAMALTFEPQPIAVLRPELRPAVLTHLPLKTQLIERLGVDELLVVELDDEVVVVRLVDVEELVDVEVEELLVVELDDEYAFHPDTPGRPGQGRDGRPEILHAGASCARSG